MARLPRLPKGPIVDPKNGEPTLAFTVYWQRLLEAQETTDARQDEFATELAQVVADLAAAQAELAQVVSDLAAAVAAIQAAQATADAAVREAARINSYTAPTDVLTASDAGSDATITVAGHARVYPVQGAYDVTDVAITGGTIVGLAFATKYWVYYDDTTLADTSPAFQATTVAADAQVGAAAGRHFVGVITTPADGGADTDGNGGAPPGGGGGEVLG